MSLPTTLLPLHDNYEIVRSVLVFGCDGMHLRALWFGELDVARRFFLPRRRQSISRLGRLFVDQVAIICQLTYNFLRYFICERDGMGDWMWPRIEREHDMI